MTATLFDLRLFLSPPLFEVVSLLLGLVVGSFANVCIHRLPRGQSVVSPPSRCPACGALIASYDNVPVLAWLWLRGRCRRCRAPISMRYPAVELLNGLLYLGLALLFGPSPATLGKMAFCTALLVLALIDLEHQILPDVITLPGLAVGLLASALGGPSAYLGALGGLAAACFVGMVTDWDRRDHGEEGWTSGLELPAMILAFGLWQRALPGQPVEPALAAGLGYLGMVLVARMAELYYRLRFRQEVEALGQGDWKMAALLGAWLGLQGMLLALFLGALGGAVVGLLLVAARRAKGRTRIPFGTFLALGGILVIFVGEALLYWHGVLVLFVGEALLAAIGSWY